MTAPALQWISSVLLLSGGVFCLATGLGLLRMPDVYTRMHAASVLDTLGAGFMLLGLMVLAGWTLVTAKLIILALLIFFAGPAVSHALAKAAREAGVQPTLSEGGSLWKR